MDNPQVATPRERPPGWATGGTPPTSEPKISAPQRNYLLDLIGKKYVKPDLEGKIDLIVKCLRISEDPEEFGMSKGKASELIEWFLKQPDKPSELWKPSAEDAERIAIGVPAGRYAVENDQGELRFYNVWVARNGKRLNVYVLHGPNDSDLRFHKTMLGVLRKIKADGIREAALRFGREIGSCSNCGRRLTNRISRELAIGPVCGGRMFGEKEWKAEVKAKRQEIVDRGEDPDEELED